MKFIFLLLSLASVVCMAESRYPAAVLNDSKFTEIKSVKNIPESVMKFCADQTGRMADPGGEWEVSDSGNDHNLPTKRLIWSIKKNNDYVIHYEYGGYVHGFMFVIATFDPASKKASLVWEGVGTKALPTFKDFAQAVKSGGIRTIDGKS